MLTDALIKTFDVKKRVILFQDNPLLLYMVPKPGLEPGRVVPTTPSR